MSDDLIEAEEGAVAPAETDAAAPAEAAASPAAPDWSSPEAQQQIDQRVQATLEQYAQQAQPEAPAADDFDFDPFDPSSVRSAIQAEASKLFDERMGQYQPAIEHSQQQWAEQWTNQQLDKLGVKDETVRAQAVYSFQAFAPSAGSPEQALQMAAQWATQNNETIRKAAAEAAIEEYKASLAGGTGPAAPVGGSGGALEVVDAPKSYEEVLAKWERLQNV